MGSRLERNSNATRKRIESHVFENENGEEYSASAFGGFGDYFRRKKLKLQNLDAELRAQSTSDPDIFRGIVAHVNGYTQPSLNDLHHMIVRHGGGFLQYLDGKTIVTHIIASSLTPKKAVEFKRYRIVKPAWIVDSIAAGKLLPWNDYRVVDEGQGQKLIGFGDGGQVISQRNEKERGYRDQTDTSWYTTQLKGAALSSQTPKAFMKSKASQSQVLETDDNYELPPSHQPEEAISSGSLQGVAVEQRDWDEEDVYDGEDLDLTSFEESPSKPTDTKASTVPETSSSEDTNALARVEPPSKRGSTPEDCQGQKRPADDEDTPTKRSKLTAEDHNRILLSDPNVRRSSVLNPDFLDQYYRESRLHHLSTWKADLKSQLQALAAEKTLSQKARMKRTAGTRRYILHVDFDSFFAAVSLKKHPEYRDKPAVVAHGSGNSSEIASCNYPARTFGIKNGMWMARAVEMCPDLKVLPYDFPGYEEASRAFYDAILATDGIVQSVSIDEALIDISRICHDAVTNNTAPAGENSSEREQSFADDLALKLRESIKEQTGCDVSVGIGANILLAKVALRKAKPAGQHQVRPDEVLDFLAPLQVRDLPGVARSLGGKLEEIGVHLVGELRGISKERLINTMGPKTGEKLWEYARGIDRVEVGEQTIRKSVSAEINWGVRFENQEQTDEFIGQLCGELRRRLLKENVRGSQLTMKVMRRSADAPLDPPKHLGHGRCDTFNKTTSLGVATNAQDIIAREALSMLKAFGFSPGELRGLGVQMTKLEPIKVGTMDSSQRRLQFKAPGKTDTAPTPSKIAQQLSEETSKNRFPEQDDPIQDEIMTPRKNTKTSSISFGPAALGESSPSRKLLNTTGTQFLLPTQVDPAILAELPPDIRTRLSRSLPKQSQSRSSLDKFTIKKEPPPAATALPSSSQLDPSILDALPADIRAELQAHYADTASPLSSPSGKPRQALLPQSPRKPKGVSSVGVKKRGRPAGVGIKREVGNATLTQFLPRKEGAGTGTQSQDEDADELDEDFLKALPADIRSELESAHAARQRLAAHRAARSSRLRSVRDPHHPDNQTDAAEKTRFVERKSKPRPTFTSRKLHTVEELRAAVSEWVKEFRDEGPYREDAEALAQWCVKVVTEERDLAKCRKVVNWLEWCVDDVDDVEMARERESLAREQPEKLEELDKARQRWSSAVEKLKEKVQSAVRDRGLGELRWE